MSDPFRRIFLDALELILKKEPAKKTLIELLQLATPGLDESNLNSPTEKRKLFRTFLARVHPDKHPTDTDRATRLCQDAKIFYENCVLTSPTPKKKRRKPSTAFPLAFTSKEKWPHISFAMDDDGGAARTCAEVSCLVSFQCINARGAIAHGKKTHLYFNSAAAIKKAKHISSSKDMFEFHGGPKELSSAEEIKTEIMERGPVVSTSFEPNEAFLKHHTILRRQKEFLIVGWIQQPAGEVWVVAPLYDFDCASLAVHVSFGQFGIDDCCVAPKSSLEHITWESGPYLDIDMSKVDAGWMTGWSSMFHETPHLSDLEPLLKEIGTVWISPSSDNQQQNQLVCIRDKSKKAHSRKGTLTSIKWVENKCWKININFEQTASC